MEEGEHMIDKRAAGILLHISSLPSGEGIGTLGCEAYKFIDFLSAGGFKIWQTLPVAPTGFGNSPYQSLCSTALNFLFIDLKSLGLETSFSPQTAEAFDRVDYETVLPAKLAGLRRAFKSFDRNDRSFRRFLAGGHYLNFALFMNFKTLFGGRPWYEWPDEYKNRAERTLKDAAGSEETEFWLFTQFVFLKQWNAIKRYAKAQDVKLMGDLPFYEAGDSAEVWAHPFLFALDDNGRPALVGGVPPDYFSADGQLWGNPVYDFAAMKRDGFRWWNERLAAAFRLFDIVRLDHFRGYDRYYEIEASSGNAKNGCWRQGPGRNIFEDKLKLSLVAEDLGIIDKEAEDLLAFTGYPGMRVMQFGFDGDAGNPHLPVNFIFNSVAYPGTHDNETLLQFFYEHLNGGMLASLKEQCRRLKVSFGGDQPEDLVKTALELLFASAAGWAIVPLQDLLPLGKEGRMNTPGTVGKDNWSYRSSRSDFKAAVSQEVRSMIKKYRS